MKGIQMSEKGIHIHKFHDGNEAVVVEFGFCMRNHIDMYIQNGYEVMNALIENADITTEEYPTVNIQLKLPCGCVVFGGYSFAKVVKGDFKLEGWEKGMTAIFRIMEVAGVNHWNKLKGSPVRAILKDDRIYGIAHFIEDKVMDYRLSPFQKESSL